MPTYTDTKRLTKMHPDGPRYERRLRARVNNKRHTLCRMKYDPEKCNNMLSRGKFGREISK